MKARWISLRRARAFVKQHHRHLPELAGGIVAMGAWKDGKLCGVGVLARPIARHVQQNEPDTAEIVRVAVDGTRNAGSFLYAKLHRLAQALGFTKTITKNLPWESGASLRAAGFEVDTPEMTKGGHWDRPSRSRQRPNYTGPKRRWKKEGHGD